VELFLVHCRGVKASEEEKEEVEKRESSLALRLVCVATCGAALKSFPSSSSHSQAPTTRQLFFPYQCLVLNEMSFDGRENEVGESRAVGGKVA
jgi:hypothetical protein